MEIKRTRNTVAVWNYVQRLRCVQLTSRFLDYAFPIQKVDIRCHYSLRLSINLASYSPFVFANSHFGLPYQGLTHG